MAAIVDRITGRAHHARARVVAAAIAMLALAVAAPVAGATGVTGATVPSAKARTPVSALPPGVTPGATAATSPNGAQPGTIPPGSTSPSSSTSPSGSTPPSGSTAPSGAAAPAPTTPAGTAPTGPAGSAGATSPSGTTLSSPVSPTTSTPAPSPSGGSTALLVGRSKHGGNSRGLSALAIALAAAGALLALVCLIWALARWLALEPRWIGAMGHSMREAGFHASATWAEFSDWAKLGR